MLWGGSIALKNSVIQSFQKSASFLYVGLIIMPSLKGDLLNEKNFKFGHYDGS